MVALPVGFAYYCFVLSIFFTIMLNDLEDEFLVDGETYHEKMKSLAEFLWI